MSEQAGDKVDGFTLSPKVRQYLAMAVVAVPVLLIVIGITYCCIRQRRKHVKPPFPNSCCACTPHCNFCGDSMSGAGDQHISGFDHETGRVRRSYNKEQVASWWRSGWYACEECRMKGRNYQRYADWCKRQQDAVNGVEVQQTRKQLKIDQKCQWEDLKDE